jgi:hypothetical protein
VIIPEWLKALEEHTFMVVFVGVYRKRLLVLIIGLSHQVVVDFKANSPPSGRGCSHQVVVDNFNQSKPLWRMKGPGSS